MAEMEIALRIGQQEVRRFEGGLWSPFCGHRVGHFLERSSLSRLDPGEMRRFALDLGQARFMPGSHPAPSDWSRVPVKIRREAVTWNESGVIVPPLFDYVSDNVLVADGYLMVRVETPTLRVTPVTRNLRETEVILVLDSPSYMPVGADEVHAGIHFRVSDTDAAHAFCEACVAAAAGEVTYAGRPGTPVELFGDMPDDVDPAERSVLGSARTLSLDKRIRGEAGLEAQLRHGHLQELLRLPPSERTDDVLGEMVSLMERLRPACRRESAFLAEHVVKIWNERPVDIASVQGAPRP
jgi:hypothetical protein